MELLAALLSLVGLFFGVFFLIKLLDDGLVQSLHDLADFIKEVRGSLSKVQKSLTSPVEEEMVPRKLLEDEKEKSRRLAEALLKEEK